MLTLHKNELNSVQPYGDLAGNIEQPGNKSLWDGGGLVYLRDRNEIVDSYTLYSRNGLHVVVWKSGQRQASKIDFEVNQQYIEFKFQLKGISRCTVFYDTCQPVVKSAYPGLWSFYLLRKSKGFMECLPADEGLSLTVSVEPIYFFKDDSELANALMFLFDETLEHAENKTSFIRSGYINHAMLSAIKGLLGCPYIGTARDLFLEAKVIELIALEMAVLTETQFSRAETAHGPDEREAIRQARDILLSNLNDPPKLSDLACRVGINRNKLNQGFRRAYGLTVFEMLRAERLEKAKNLIQNSDLPLAQIAQASGFCAQSHFTSAFTAHFGVPPGRFRKRISPVSL